jgi:cyanophycinase
MRYLFLTFTSFIMAFAFYFHQEQRPAPLSFSIPAATDTVKRYLFGQTEDVQTSTKPGLVLAGGGGDVSPAMKWLLERSGGGDIVVIRSSGADGYNKYLFELHPVNSVESIVIDSKAKANDPSVIAAIRNAEALFIAGGDQWNYVNYWKDGPVEDAINYLLNEKKVPVGGTSAGLAILGASYFSAQNDGVNSTEALSNPYHKKVTVSSDDFLQSPFLQNTITDSHYSQRKRQGRHVVFMTRMMQDGHLKKVRGIGIDEATAVCVDEKGMGKVFGKNLVYFLHNTGEGPEMCKPDSAFTWSRNQQAIQSYTVQADSLGSGSFNLKKWKGVTGGYQQFLFVENGVLHPQ